MYISQGQTIVSVSSSSKTFVIISVSLENYRYSCHISLRKCNLNLVLEFSGGTSTVEVAICKITEKCLGCVQSQRKISLSSYLVLSRIIIVLKIIVQFEINPNFPRGA